MYLFLCSSEVDLAPNRMKILSAASLFATLDDSS
jgi:hypothetical protein